MQQNVTNKISEVTTDESLQKFLEIQKCELSE